MNKRTKSMIQAMYCCVKSVCIKPFDTKLEDVVVVMTFPLKPIVASKHAKDPNREGLGFICLLIQL